MHDKVETETSTPSETKVTFGHRYYETGADILSKPRALVDLIESMGVPTAVIFCNAPSEADLVAAMLRKSGINCQKLIGHVPSSKVEQTNEDIQAGTIKIVVSTDIGATELNMNNFEYIVNYSIHEDPETYFNRCADVKAGAKIQKVLSLVSPLDIGNFHYLNKLAEFEFEKAELPTKADLMKSKLNKLFEDAVASNQLAGEGMSELIDQILGHSNAKSVVAMLLNNTLVSLPEALAQVRPKGQPQERGEYSDRGGDRDGGDRGGRGDRRNDGRNRRDRDGGFEDRGPRRTQEETFKPEVRYYLGMGTSAGITVDQIKGLIVEKGVEASIVKRVFLREGYGFVDAEPEAADQVLAALKDIEISGTKLYSVKATELPGSRSDRGGDRDRGDYRGGGDRRRHNSNRRDNRDRDRNFDQEGGRQSQAGSEQSEESFEDDENSQIKMLANYKGRNDGGRGEI